MAGLTEYRRFTLRQVRAGEASGWRFAAGWFSVPGGAGPWAWFWRGAGAAAPGSSIDRRGHAGRTFHDPIQRGIYDAFVGRGRAANIGGSGMRLPWIVILAHLSFFTGLDAKAEATKVPYVGGIVGINVLQDSAVRDDFGNNFNATLEPGFILGAVGGYDFRVFRPEAQLVFLVTELDDFEAGGSSLRVDGELSSLFLLVNSWFDFENRSSVTPYAGAGFGPGRIHISRVSAAGSTLYESDTATVLGYQAGIGLRIGLTRRVLLDAGYQYLGSSDPSFAVAEAEFAGSVFRIGAHVAIGSVSSR